MNIDQALTLLAAQLKADAAELIAYAAEDDIGGYDIDERNRIFPMGSLWAPEGKILYALVRWLKPDVVAEIGGWVGCSGSHLAAAVQKNGHGKVFSVDSGAGGQDHGYMLLPHLRPYVELVTADGRDWLAAQADQSIGLIFEDADHSTALTAQLSKLAATKLEAGGVLVNHDAAHDFAIVGGGQKIRSSVGREIRDGLEQAGLYFRTYLADPSDCGVAVTVMPGVRNMDIHSTHVKADESPVKVMPQFGEDPDLVSEVPRQIGNAHIESVSPPPPAKAEPKRKRK